jgi:hypothetical protein
MTHVLVDDDGALFRPNSENFRRRLDLAPEGIDLARFTVRNMGYIEVRREDDQVVIRARPQIVGPAAIRRVATEISRWRVKRFVLRLLDEATDVLIVPSAEIAVQRLEAVCRERSNHADWSEFSTTPLRLDDLRGRGYDGMHLLASGWSALRGVLDEEVLDSVLRLDLPCNVATLRRCPEEGSLLVERSRIVEAPWKSAWMRRLDHYDLRDHPDRRYSAWLVRTYDDVLLTKQPRLERVDALLRCPEFGTRSFRYDRLVLPWRRRSGERVATLCSVVHKVGSA